MIRPGIGNPVLRREDRRFLVGAGRYIDDVTLPGMAYAFAVRSPHAHAVLGSIDTTEAEAMPGVLAVLTGADVRADGLGELDIRGIPPGFGGAGAFLPTRPILAQSRLRHVGDIVAFVVAETYAAAKDAGERIAIDYQPRPAAVSASSALSPEAAPIWDEAPGNVCLTHQAGDAEATNAAFADAAHVVRIEAHNNRLSANPIEPRGAIGAYDPIDDRFTLRISAQNPHRIREVLAESVFRVPETSIRVIAGDVGGGFGMKGPVFPEEALVLWAARRLGRPVKWIADRSESFVSDVNGRDQNWQGEMALDGDGRIRGLRATVDFALGAYLVGTSHVPLLLAVGILPSVYHFPALHVTARGVFTNTTPTSPYRGAGQPEAIYLVERLIEQAAAVTALSSEEIRRRNYIRPAEMPYATPAGHTYDGGDFAAATRKALTLADHAGFAKRRAEAGRRGMLRGFGFAYFIEITALHGDRVDIRMDPSGGVTVTPGTFSHGQGHETVLAQLTAEWLGVPMERIRILQGDTDQVAFGRGTYASRSATVGGAALRNAADEVIARGRKFAAHLLEAADTDIEFSEGVFSVAGTDRSIPISAVAAAAYAPAGLPPSLGIGLEGAGVFAPETPNYPNGCHVCEVEIDPETGRINVVGYAAVDDVGRALNPLLLEGQVHGGVAQGVGQALMEEIVFDNETGQLLTASFLDYAMPRADDLPMIRFDHHDVPCTTNPLGVKGAGEAGCVGAPPALINAVLDALKPLNIDDIGMPATPERVWRAIQQARAG